MAATAGVVLTDLIAVGGHNWAYLLRPFQVYYTGDDKCDKVLSCLRAWEEQHVLLTAVQLRPMRLQWRILDRGAQRVITTYTHRQSMNLMILNELMNEYISNLPILCISTLNAYSTYFDLTIYFKPKHCIPQLMKNLKNSKWNPSLVFSPRDVCFATDQRIKSM